MILKEKIASVVQEQFQYLKQNYWKKVITDTLAKISQNIIAYSFISEHTRNFCYFEKKAKFFAKANGG